MSDSADELDLSIVIPLHNEAENVEPLVDEIFETVGALDLRFELILVDDGSRDETFDRLRRRAAQHPNVRLIRFARNYGQTAGLSAGFHAARGPLIVTLDGDLQNDPRDIPALLTKLDEGYDVVSGWRKNRQDTFINRTLPSRIANRLISRSTGVTLHDYGCALKVYRKSVLDRFELYGQLHRFLPALCAMAGARVAEIVVNHRARERGATKYGIGRTLTVLLDLTTVKFMLSYGAHPIRVFGMASVLSGLVGVASLAATIGMKFSPLGVDMTGNPLLYLAMMGVIVAAQFMLMGVIAEMLTRTYHEAQGKRPYIVIEQVNVE
ncbi:MAG: glycosyltransferase [Acidobacteria bacterium]|nr:glycosyltransferase [Acidobacteriota bacterium]